MDTQVTKLLNRLWLRRPSAMLILLLLPLATFSSPSVRATATAAKEDALRRLEAVKGLPAILREGYVHTHYQFELNRRGMHRRGQGELWMSFQDGKARVRLRGIAESPRFGKGYITIVLDSVTQSMFVRVELLDTHEDQCVRYPFPESHSGDYRHETLEWRKLQVLEWQIGEILESIKDVDGEHDERFRDGKLLPMNWTRSSRLEFLVSQDGKDVLGLNIRKNKRIVKKVRLRGIPEVAKTAPQGSDLLWMPPESGCKLESELKDEIAKLDLKPPHRKSSALNDLLIMLSKKDPNPVKFWSRMYLTVNALTLPGDIAVMLDDPEPPHPERLGTIMFDYVATVADRGPIAAHKSEGTMWLNTQDQVFRLKGGAKGTKVGDLEIDLLARAGPRESQNVVYARVALDDEGEQQCIAYEYPTVGKESIQQLEDASKIELSFWSIAEFDGEDCGIFTAPMARGRFIHIWVDLEEDNPDIFLRTEVHHNGKVLRTTDVKKWKANAPEPSLRPDPKWNCLRKGEEVRSSERLARLDISHIHKKSIQLQDALYSIKHLSPSFALREVLGATGDVAVMVTVPELPKFGEVKDASFNYVMTLEPTSAPQEVIGAFGVHQKDGMILAEAYHAASAHGVAGKTLLKVTSEAVSVKLESSGKSECITIPAPQAENSHTATGVFEGVEAVGGRECNKFVLTRLNQHVDVYYSEEDDVICRLDVHLPGASKSLMHISVSNWVAPSLNGRPMRAKLPPKVIPQNAFDNCQLATAMPGQAQWAFFRTEPQASHHFAALPGVIALGSLGKALGITGLIPALTGERLSSLVVRAPAGWPNEGVAPEWQSFAVGASHAPVPPVPTIPQQVTPPTQQATARLPLPTIPPKSQPSLGPAPNILSPHLKSYRFSFSSTYPLQARSRGLGDPVHRTRGYGEVRVDLEKKRLYMRNEAMNVSEGIPMVESKVIYRADQGKIWVKTKTMDAIQGEVIQCWTMRTTEVLPTSTGAIPNPFLQGRVVPGGSFSIPGNVDLTAQKYVVQVDRYKRVEFYVDLKPSLVAMNFDYLDRDITASVLVQDWSTETIEEKWFEMGTDWKCTPTFVSYAEQLGDWELIKVLLPLDSVAESRRLNVV
eukprot:TRINITY_DN13150_c0_g1_i1.p1 TRINITY_DN13150_c0_g1~~TRINITY_DN13150_c0_g1_i1.p1  ORF type:complete len:1111 (-),score=170.43 TRINITY_DN13150_c0_g1_i1:330-3662(-)